MSLHQAELKNLTRWQTGQSRVLGQLPGPAHEGVEQRNRRQSAGAQCRMHTGALVRFAQLAINFVFKAWLMLLGFLASQVTERLHLHV